jgi:hypothetical protein
MYRSSRCARCGSVSCVLVKHMYVGVRAVFVFNRIHVYICMCVFMCVCLYMCAECGSVSGVLRIHVCMYICICVHLFVYVCRMWQREWSVGGEYVCISAYVYVCTCGVCDIHTCMHTNRNHGDLQITGSGSTDFNGFLYLLTTGKSLKRLPIILQVAVGDMAVRAPCRHHKHMFIICNCWK